MTLPISLTPAGLTFADGTTQSSASMHFKNRIINGNMIIDQKAHGLPYRVSQYNVVQKVRVIDRWIFTSTGSPYTQPGTVVRNSTNYTNSSGTNYKIPSLTFNSSGSVSTTTTIGFAQRIESIYTQDLGSQDVTLSVSLCSNTATTFYWAAYYPLTKDQYPTTTPPSDGVPVYYNCNQIAGGSWTTGGTSSTLTDFSATFNAGTGVTQGLVIYIFINVPANQTSSSLSITNVQLELGVGKSTFDTRTYNEELYLCQRYLYVDGTATRGELAYNYLAGGYGPNGISSLSFVPQARVGYGSKSGHYDVVLKYTFPQPIRSSSDTGTGCDVALFYYRDSVPGYTYDDESASPQARWYWNVGCDTNDQPCFVQGSGLDELGIFGDFVAKQSVTQRTDPLGFYAPHTEGGTYGVTFGFSTASASWYSTYGYNMIGKMNFANTNLTLQLRLSQTPSTPQVKAYFGLAFTGEL